jgi:hypothetical protein
MIVAATKEFFRDKISLEITVVITDRTSVDFGEVLLNNASERQGAAIAQSI